MLSALLFALCSRGAHGVLEAEDDSEAAGWLLAKRCICSITTDGIPHLLRFRELLPAPSHGTVGGMTTRFTLLPT